MKNNLRSGIPENKLLSICIPTFNRADYLKNTLYSITEQEKFSKSCEVIISDNNSTDNTRDIGEYFSEKYENVRYYCNETNIGAERNFLKLLNYGQGKYLKLHNDRACFYENKLNELVHYLESTDHKVILLLNENTKYKKGNIECKNFDEFVRIVSYWSTWMSGIIFKNYEYMNLKEKDRAIGSEIIQTDIMFRILARCKSSLIINEKMLYEQKVESKGGYNLFKIFLDNYLSLYDEYLNDGLLNYQTYKDEKINLLTKFIFPWFTNVVILRRNKYHFIRTDALRFIFKHYKKFPQLYFYPFYLIRLIMLKLENAHSNNILRRSE